ncbi:MAG: hypothetical protein JWQ90_5035 [Hydrocarboniphaga sp.]|uniref:hypothetical protein n=1 Tax=Hydrocarboniphaga sp. TaxID=2033016 RepID=UPI002624880B|nr:hypothetical protein [Hydrocarboniphaga sp.]MDB5972585.1 hypothetical protein [Hydrocarboniphaga sp.]
MQPTEPDSKPLIKPRIKRPNSFQLLGGILAAAAGVRGNSARGRGFADASTGAILGALLIFCTLAALGCYAFIHAIKSAVAN